MSLLYLIYHIYEAFELLGNMQEVTSKPQKTKLQSAQYHSHRLSRSSLKHCNGLENTEKWSFHVRVVCNRKFYSTFPEFLERPMRILVGTLGARMLDGREFCRRRDGQPRPSFSKFELLLSPLGTWSRKRILADGLYKHVRRCGLRAPLTRSFDFSAHESGLKKRVQ